MSTVRSVPTDVTVPDAAAGSVTFVVPDGAIGPVDITLADSGLNLRLRLRQYNGSNLASLPTFIEGTQQVILFEEGERVTGAHGYEAYHDGAGGQTAVLTYRSEP